MIIKKKEIYRNIGLFFLIIKSSSEIFSKSSSTLFGIFIIVSAIRIWTESPFLFSIQRT